MFDELIKYPNNGHFFFKKGDRLSEVSREVPEMPGVYYILLLSKGKIELVYIGKAGTVAQNGRFKDQKLKGRINNKQDGVPRQQFFDQKMKDENIDGLDICWFVTMDKNNSDLPGFVEGLLVQRHFELQGKLPLWNRDF